jgi:CheY-like chemotaxis protein
VLVVDDDDSVTRLLGAVFNEEKIEFDVAHNGVEALQLLAKHRYAVTLIDLEMPVLGGVELLKKMRSVMTRLPVVFVLTAHFREHAAALDESTVNAVIRKPFEPDDIASLVRTTLQRIA